MMAVMENHCDWRGVYRLMGVSTDFCGADGDDVDCALRDDDEEPG